MNASELRLETYVVDSDGTTHKVSLDLLGRVFRLRPNGWTPTIMPFFETWVNSPFAEGRGLVDAIPDNTVDTFSIDVAGTDPDRAIWAQRTLHHLLLLVFSYKKRIVDYPVWIKLTGKGQANTGYAVIEGWQTPASASPFQPPLVVDGDGQVIVDGFSLAIEHKPWTENEPGTATCVPLAVTSDYDGRTLGVAVESCLEVARVNCQHVMANLTDAYHYDASGPAFSANLMDAALPFDLLPAVPAAADIVYFIIDTTLPNSGPFNNLVFNLSVVQVDLTMIWEYWNGAWQALLVRDNTDNDGAVGAGDPFDTAGDKSVHWYPPHDWVTTTINGITGYIVRCRVTAIGAAPAPPTQAERLVYSVTWPYIDVDEDNVPGDISAIARLYSKQQSGNTGLWEFFFGARRLSRGADFSAYLNISDEQVPAGLTPTLGAGSAWVNDIVAPTGRAGQNAAFSSGVWVDRIIFHFSPALGSHYFGVYHAFLRVDTTGTAAEWSLRLRVAFGTQYFTDPVSPVSGVAYEILDMGRVWIGNTLSMRSFDQFETVVDSSQVAIQVQKAGANATITYYDLILIPTDEKLSHTYYTGDLSYHHQVLDIDSISVPRVTKRTLLRDENDLIRAEWQPLDGGPFILQARADQRIWALWLASSTDGPLEQAATVLLSRNARYMSMRGGG